eukprot:scaffold396195_cov19-Prasinocladus_malaysianus.AAC.1
MPPIGMSVERFKLRLENYVCMTLRHLCCLKSFPIRNLRRKHHSVPYWGHSRGIARVVPVPVIIPLRYHHAGVLFKMRMIRR